MDEKEVVIYSDNELDLTKLFRELKGKTISDIGYARQDRGIEIEFTDGTLVLLKHNDGYALNEESWESGYISAHKPRPKPPTNAEIMANLKAPE